MTYKNLIGLALAGGVALAGAGCAQEFDDPDFVHDEGQPWCDELEAGNGATDCALLLGDDHLLFFEYTAAGYGHHLRVNLNTLEGQEVQSFGPITIEGARGGPALRDINGDEREELFIPLLTGNVNTLYAVWQLDEDGLFRRAGEVSGYGVEGFDVRDGLLITESRGSATTYFQTASRLTADGLGTVYELVIDYAARACRLTDTSGLAMMRINAAELVAECESRAWE